MQKWSMRGLIGDDKVKMGVQCVAVQYQKARMMNKKRNAKKIYEE